jgi:hypothetical protein
VERNGEQGLAMFWELGDRWGRPMPLSWLAELAEVTGGSPLMHFLRRSDEFGRPGLSVRMSRTNGRHRRSPQPTNELNGELR